MADPLAGGSSSSSSEPKTEYDEELDFFSSNFNPELALYTPDVVVPYPDIKSFGSVKTYEDTIKSRAKSRAASESKKNAETPVGKPHQTESAAHEKAQQSKRIKSLSSEATTSCDKPVAALENVTESKSKSKKNAETPVGKPHQTESSAHAHEKAQQSKRIKSLSSEATTTCDKPVAALENVTESKSKSKKSAETPVGKPHQTESSAHEKAQQSKRIKSLSSQATTSCDKPVAALENVEKRIKRQGKSPLCDDSCTESTPQTTEEEALDLSLKTSSVLTQAVPKRTESPSATPTSSRNYGKPSKYSSREEDKQHQKSRLKDKPQLSVGSHSSRERSVSSSSRSAEASGSRETSKKSHSAVRNDNSGLTTPVKNLTIQIPCTSSEELSDRIVKVPKSNPDYLRKSEKHLRASCSSDEKRSHSESSHYSEKHHSELSRRHERSSSARDTHKLSRFNEKSADTSVRSQERGSHASKHSKRPAGTYFFSSKSKNTERPLDVSGAEHETRVILSTSHSHSERRHSEKKHSLQTQAPRPVASRLPKTPVDYKKEIPPAEATDSSAGKKSQKDKKTRNVFVRMEKMIGPLHVLTRCVQERLQVRVMTRGAVTVKSICRGYVVAFDKHFNMALVDVDEIYRRPAVLGKIKSKRSQKLFAAQKTLQKEREGYVAKWSDEQSLQHASSSLQDLSLEPSTSKDQKFSSHVSRHQEELPTAGTNPSVQLASASLDHPGSGEEEAQNPFNKLSKSARAKLFRMQSVYEGHKVPLSPFEREALMLGIADENVIHRHINQLLIRGENVVSVSIIEDI